jgi:hypothetical protein
MLGALGPQLLLELMITSLVEHRAEARPNLKAAWPCPIMIVTSTGEGTPNAVVSHPYFRQTGGTKW